MTNCIITMSLSNILFKKIIQMSQSTNKNTYILFNFFIYLYKTTYTMSKTLKDALKKLLSKIFLNYILIIYFLENKSQIFDVISHVWTVKYFIFLPCLKNHQD